MSFAGTLFARQLFSEKSYRRIVFAILTSFLAATTLSAQANFLGAQRTVPATGLSGPNGAAIDRVGNIFIADSGNNRIIKIDPLGAQTIVSVAPLTLSIPLAIAIDSSNNLFVTDANNNRVVKIPAAGGAATSFASVLTPDGLAVDSNGNVFVADNEDGSIVKITSAGVKSNFATGLANPIDVAVDISGNVYLADGSLSNIVKYPAAGGAGTNVGSALGPITGVAVDAAGNVYVAETGEGAAIIKISPLGIQTTLATSGLNAATYLTVDSNYNLFIPDNSASQVIEFSTASVPLGIANACAAASVSPCSQTATLQFEVIEDSITNIGVVTSGDSNLDFAGGEGTTCSGTTSPCSVQVIFSPTQPGLRTGAVQITSEGSGQSLNVPLSGTGNAAEVAFVPALTSPPFGTDGFQDPVAVAVSGGGVYSPNSRFFIADDQACVIWISGEGDFAVFAGTYGTCGYSGDSGAATTAQIGNPEDVTLDGAGNVYFVEGSTGVVRKVDRAGNISTVAGDPEQSPGFGGDGGPAKNAALSNPNGLAFDAVGNFYIADTGNHRIRKVDLNGIITTVAGTGTAGFSGDAAPATSAKLNAPYGVRADAAGNLFIADSNNNVIRKVDLNGKISTVAGNFAAGAGYAGDGGLATSAQLAFPIYVSLDAAGQLYIADDDNSVIRRVDGHGKISTFVVPTSFPSDLVVDPTGNLAMIDPDDEALTLVARTIPNSLEFGSTNVNTATAAQDVAVTSIGNQPLTFASIVPPTGFTLGGPHTSCATSSALNPGFDCLLGIIFDPATAGNYEDSVLLTDNSVGVNSTGSQNISVTGTGVQPVTPSTTTLTAAPQTAFVDQTVTLTATISPVPTGTLGTVNFCLNGATVTIRPAAKPIVQKSMRAWRANPTPQMNPSSCGSGTLLDNISVDATGKAVLATSDLPLGTNSITAVYSGNGTLGVSTSTAVSVTINPVADTTTSLTISPNPGFQGQSVTLTGTISPVPSTAPLGTVTFCDPDSAGPKVRRRNETARAKGRRAASSLFQSGVEKSPCGGDASLGDANVNSQGVATLAVSTLLSGDHNIYAVYSGAVGFNWSSSDPVDETVNPAYNVAAPPTPFTVGQGGNVAVTVNLPPLGGSYDDVVTLSATGLPAGATVTFDPPTVTPGACGATTVMTVQLLVVPGINAAATPAPRLPLAPLGTALALCCAFFFYQRFAPRVGKPVLLFASLFLVASFLSSCNGGFHGKPGTIPGNYVITVIGTSGTLHPSTTVTITVQ